MTFVRSGTLAKWSENVSSITIFSNYGAVAADSTDTTSFSAQIYSRHCLKIIYSIKRVLFNKSALSMEALDSKRVSVKDTEGYK